jgi:hypothetical protein
MAQATAAAGRSGVTVRGAIRRTATMSYPVIVILFAVVSGVVIGLAALVLGLVFGGGAGQRAIIMSAAIGWVVQMLAFVIALRLRDWNVMAAWTVGMVLRLGALMVYGLVGVRALSLVPDAALVSLAVFFFLSTLTEPWFLRS